MERALVQRLICGALALSGCGPKGIILPPPSMALPPSISSPATEAFAAPAPGYVNAPVRAPLPQRVVVHSEPRSEEFYTVFPTGAAGDQAGDYSLAGREAPVPELAFSNAQILRIATTVDEGQIAQAKLVEARTASAPVKEFAKEVRSQHIRSKQDAAVLAKRDKIQPEESGLANDLRKEGVARLDSLEQARPSDVDRIYLSAQIDQHTRTLNLLDGHLIPNATDAELRAQLERTRAMVAGQLAAAQRMWASLKKSEGR